MAWQYLLIGYLILATVVGLLQRQLGQTIPQYNRLINAFFFLCVHYPLALITAAVVGFHLHIGWFNAATLVGVSMLFPATDVLAFRASKDVDAGLFGIIQNLNPVITIALAVLLLSERLTPHQAAGTLIIIFSALVVSAVSYNHGSKSTQTGIVLALLTVTLLGVGTVYETWMLRRVGYGAYLIYGTGIQTFWMTIFAWPQRQHIREVINRHYGFSILSLSLAKSLKGLAILGALYLSRSASLVSAFSSFLPVMLVVAGFVFLHERQYLKLKVSAALAGSAGLIILSLGR